MKFPKYTCESCGEREFGHADGGEFCPNCTHRTTLTDGGVRELPAPHYIVEFDIPEFGTAATELLHRRHAKQLAEAVNTLATVDAEVVDIHEDVSEPEVTEP